MTAKPVHSLAAMLAGAALVLAPLPGQLALTTGMGGAAMALAVTPPPPPPPHYCPKPGGSTVIINKPVTINKSISINKPVTINNSVTVNKPVTINKNISVYNPVTINKTIDASKTINVNNNVSITKNIDASKNISVSKNINIQKNITINNGGASSAAAYAYAAASAQASANVIVYGGSQYVSIANHNNVGGAMSVNAQARCVVQEANVVKSIHAVCVDKSGREFPASHMVPDTWLDQSYEGEIARCIPGATIRAMVGDVLQSDHGLAGTYEHGEALVCGPGEALVHYRGGMVKCAPAKPVKDCTERTNLRRWGSGDFFFSYHAQVCVTPASQAATGPQDLSGMTLDGGVGADDSAY